MTRSKPRIRFCWRFWVQQQQRHFAFTPCIIWSRWSPPRVSTLRWMDAVRKSQPDANAVHDIALLPKWTLPLKAGWIETSKALLAYNQIAPDCACALKSPWVFFVEFSSLCTISNNINLSILVEFDQHWSLKCLGTKFASLNLHDCSFFSLLPSIQPQTICIQPKSWQIIDKAKCRELAKTVR